MEYLSSNLLKAYPFVDNGNVERDHASWPLSLSVPSGSDYSFGASSSIAQRIFSEYPGNIYSLPCAEVLTTDKLLSDLFADLSISTNFSIIGAELGVVHYDKTNGYLCFGIVIHGFHGTYYWMSEPVTETGTMFKDVSAMSSLLYETDGNGKWWRRLQDGSESGDMESGGASVSVRAVLGSSAIAQIIAYADTLPGTSVLEILPSLKVESRAISAVDAGGMTLAVYNRSGPNFATNTAVAETWAGAGNMSMARVGHTMTLLKDGRVLVTGGSTQEGDSAAPFTASAEIYDPLGNTWTLAAPMPKARKWHGAALLDDGRVLVAGGEADPTWDYMSTGDIFNPATGTWISVPGTFPYVRDPVLVATQLNTVIVLGGTSAYPTSYDVTANVWSQLASSYPFSSPGLKAVPLTDGTVLAYFSAGSATYDPATDTWTEVYAGSVMNSSAMSELEDGDALSVNSNSNQVGYVIGNVELFRDGAWEQISLLASPRSYPTVTKCGARALIAGGVTTSGNMRSTTVDVFEDGAVRTVGPLASPRFLHKAVALDDNKILVAGGLVADSFGTAAVASAEIFSFTEASYTQSGGDTVTLVSGIVTLKGGYNIDVSGESGALKLEAGAGLGAGPVPCRNFQTNAPEGVQAGSEGDLKLEGDACHTMVPYVPTDTIYLFGNCEACCSCDDYSNFFKALKKYGLKWVQTWNILDTIKSGYEEAKLGYDSYRKKVRMVTAKCVGSLTRGAYFNESAGVPQWVKAKTNADQDVAQTFPLHARVVCTIHNPNPTWYSNDGKTVAQGPSIRVKNVTLQLVPGFAMVNTVFNTGTLTFYTAKESMKLPLGTQYVNSNPAGSGNFSFDLTTTVAGVPSGQDSILLDPCTVLVFDIAAVSSFTTEAEPTVFRRMYATVSWDLEITGDEDDDGLPDIADAAMKGIAPNFTHAKSAQAIIDFT